MVIWIELDVDKRTGQDCTEADAYGDGSWVGENEGRYEEAANEMLKWVFCNGRRLRGLVLRRMDERALFLAWILSNIPLEVLALLGLNWGILVTFPC